MIDPEKAFRRAIYQALNGNLVLTVDGSNSPVALFDGPIDDDGVNLYVILGDQSGAGKDTKSSLASDVSLTLDIICRQSYEANKEFVDDIAEQIDIILRPSSATSGLVGQTGVQFGRLKRSDARYLELSISTTQTIMRKLVTYSTRAYQAA